MSCDTEVGTVTTDYRVLYVRRRVWSLGSMMDSGLRCTLAEGPLLDIQHDGKELDVIRGGGEFFVAAAPTMLTPRNPSTLELNPVTAAEVEQAELIDKKKRSLQRTWNCGGCSIGR